MQAPVDGQARRLAHLYESRGIGCDAERLESSRARIRSEYGCARARDRSKDLPIGATQMHHDCRRKVGFVPYMTIVLGAALVASACSHSRNTAAQPTASPDSDALATNLSPVLSMHDVMT